MKMLPAARKLEAWLQEEIGAHQRTLVLLNLHQEALVRNDAGEVERTAQEMLNDADQRCLRKERATLLLNEAGSLAGLQPGTLTMGALAERLGGEGERLSRLRRELAPICRQTMEQSRRVSAVAKHQRALVRDMLCGLLRLKPGQDVEHSQGNLVDGRA